MVCVSANSYKSYDETFSYKKLNKKCDFNQNFTEILQFKV